MINLKNIVIPLNAELNPICHLLALLAGATTVIVSRLRVNYIKAQRPDGRITSNMTFAK